MHILPLVPRTRKPSTRFTCASLNGCESSTQRYRSRKVLAQVRLAHISAEKAVKPPLALFLFVLPRSVATATVGEHIAAPRCAVTQCGSTQVIAGTTTV